MVDPTSSRATHLIAFDVPGPYEVIFTTRVGGVSEGPYESMNLGLMTGDEPERVRENRRRACAQVGADAAELAVNRQVHGSVVNHARRGARGEPGDAIWTDDPGVPVGVLTADCVPIVLARVNGDRPALGLVHAGWRGLLAGVVETAAAAISGRLAAVVGPAIARCCYEVGPEVCEAFGARFGRHVLAERNVDLAGAAEQALRQAGVELVGRVGMCTACHPELFFSHRRDGEPTGRQGVIGVIHR